MAATRIGTWKKCMHVRLDVALHVGGPVGSVVCPSTICYVQPWNESHVTKSTKRGNNTISQQWNQSVKNNTFIPEDGFENSPYQQFYDALLKYTNPSENILIEIMEISALHAELHNDGLRMQLYDMLKLAKLLLIIGLGDYTLSDGDMIRNRNGFEEDIDGVLYKYMFVGRATEEFRILLLSHMLCACKTKV
ncbi:hypothetical protein OUZ56_004257 [Daphnia magna]|uniref:Uncharacterized protein n=1 Tax=Daphnia magna TaxID=35525 RepID=A0ABQ9YP76_9CRUS|nr:hypothetical protein OUZ56_004257 [Daphnia magna]